jgi:hypothetical protein
MKEIENIVEKQTEKKYLSKFYFHDRAILLWIPLSWLPLTHLYGWLLTFMATSSTPLWMAAHFHGYL